MGAARERTRLHVRRVRLTSSSADVAALAAEFGSRFTGLDVLYNNAGTTVGKPLLGTTDADWDLVLNINLR